MREASIIADHVPPYAVLGLIQNLYHLARERGLSIDNTPVCTVRAEVCGSREELMHLADSLFPYGLYAWVTKDMDGDDNPAGRIATWIAQGARVGHTTVAEQPVLRGAEVRDNALVLEYSVPRNNELDERARLTILPNLSEHTSDVVLHALGEGRGLLHLTLSFSMKAPRAFRVEDQRVFDLVSAALDTWARANRYSWGVFRKDNALAESA